MRSTNRPMGVLKTENEYQKLVSREVYEKTPKAVFAAIAISYMVNLVGISFDGIDNELIKEWKILHGNKIVPQKPTVKSKR